MYGDVVLGMKPTNKEDIDPFEAIIEEVKEAKGVKLDKQAVCRRFFCAVHIACLV